MSVVSSSPSATEPLRSRRRARSVAPARAVRPRAAARITSLDAVRGLMLLWSVTSDSLLAPSQAYDHAPWIGVHPVDLVFPIFVTLSGCGLAFACARRVALVPMARRVVVLLVVGAVYNVVVTVAGPGTWPGLAGFRLTGVLQMYAGIVVFMALGHLLTRRAWGWLLITAVLTAAHTTLLATWARGCPQEVLSPECNPSGVIDAAVFTAGHMYSFGSRGHDPEGLVGLLGACITASAGATAGHALLAARRRYGHPAGAVVPLVALAAVLATGSLLTGALVPAMKRLWTPPFALGVAALVVVVLLAVHLLLDRARRAPSLDVAAWPLLALGRNSLLVYFGSHATMAVLLSVVPAAGQVSIAQGLAERMAVGGHVQLTWSALVLCSWVALACLLHSRRIYLRP